MNHHLYLIGPGAKQPACLDDLEAFEGMSVFFPQALVISEYFNFDRFGEMVLTVERAAQPTAVFAPGRMCSRQSAWARRVPT